ncbi:MAG: hypothetical protein V1731_00710 [Candidatus Aenigmatarchaeota archaeon]
MPGIKNYKIYILLVCLLASLFAIGYDLREGVVVSSVRTDSDLYNIIKPGMVITEIDGAKIKNVADFESFATPGSHFLVADGNSYSFDIGENRSVSFFVKEIPKNTLEFGLDLQGGTRVTLTPREKITSETVNSEIIPVLQNRINTYGLKEVNLRSNCDINNCYVIVEASGASRDIIESLLSSKGSFDGKMPVVAETHNAAGTIKLGKNSYPFRILSDGIEINNSVVSLGEKFYLENIHFELTNITENEVIALANIFLSQDIETVFTDPQHSFIQQSGNGYSFVFQILLSKNGAERFAKITSGMDSKVDTDGKKYLVSPLVLYLDGKPVTELNVAADLAGRVITQVSIEGWRATREEATQERSMLQSILKSGALPVTFDVGSVSTISPTLGYEFFNSALVSAGLAILAVATIVMIRYRNLKVVIPMVLTSLSEIVIIVGIAAFGRDPWVVALVLNLVIIIYAAVKKEDLDFAAVFGALLVPFMGIFLSWTIDIASIGGIIASIGTGINQMIIITDEIKMSGHKLELMWQEKIKRAFVIIFASASTVVAAMVPLIFIGVGLVRGFAITTIVGVLVGVLITRPAYGKISESTVA